MKKYFLLSSIIVFLGIITFFYYISAETKAIKLVGLGDSITHGSGDPSKKGYIERVGLELEKARDVPVRVGNFGVPKQTTEDLLVQLKDRKIKNKVKKANYIMVCIGTNDFRKSAGYEFDQLHINNINHGKTIFEGNLRLILDIIRSNNSDAPIMVLGLYHPYTEYLNQQEILAVVEQWNDEMTNVINDFDKVYYVPTLDLFEGNPKEKYFSDSIHPNSAGYQMISDRILEKVTLLEGF